MTPTTQRNTDMSSTTETEPKGKKTIRRTVRGSICGFIGRTNWINFGEAFDDHAEMLAAQWLAD